MQTYTYSHVPQQEFMKLLTVLFLVLLASLSFVMLAEIYIYIYIICFILILVAALYLKPIIGIYLFILCLPIQSITFWLNIGWSSPHRIPIYEFLAVLMLPAAIAKELASYSKTSAGPDSSQSPWLPWIIFFSAAFVAWSALTLLWCENSDKGFFGWWRLNCNFVLCSLLLLYVKDYKQFVRIMVFYSSVSLVLVITAIYSSHYGFLGTYDLIRYRQFTLDLEATLINAGGSFDPKAAGEFPGIRIKLQAWVGCFPILWNYYMLFPDE